MSVPKFRKGISSHLSNQTNHRLVLTHVAKDLVHVTNYLDIKDSIYTSHMNRILLFQIFKNIDIIIFFNAAMWLKLDSAPTSVAGTPMLAATSLPGLELPLLAATVWHKLLHQMEMQQLMRLSLSLPMN